MTRFPHLALFAACATAGAQTAPAPSAPPPAKPPVARSQEPPIRALSFTNGKVILGMPPVDDVDFAPCSGDGTTYIGAANRDLNTNDLGDFYSVSNMAEVKHILRKLPTDFDTVSFRDFFAGEHTLITLFRATRNGAREDDPPRETVYLLSLSDHDGDSARLITLDIKFEPLKVAITGGGDILLLGWERANELPVLAAIKDDGTVKSFIDLDNRVPGQDKPQRFSASLLEAAAATQSTAPHAPTQRPTARSPLERAAFVAYDSTVLLTFPFTTLPVRILSGSGVVRSVTMQLPPGFVLHDVLSSGRSNTWGVRAQDGPVKERSPSAEASTSPATPQDASPKLALYSISAYNGSRVTSYKFDTPRKEQINCAASYRFTTIFSQPIPGASDALFDPSGKPIKPPTQWVVATAPR